ATFTLLIAAPADAGYTVSRPIDNFLGNWLDHTYTTFENWSCVESFGGGCDCGGQSPCVWWEHASTNGTCTNSWFSAHWSYGVQGVCHQATNNQAYYMGGPGGITNSSIRGMGLSIGMFGNWGTDGGC
ncbi:MAG TPA: hypothetical protein VII38_12890, partial [Polyangia bacterium]